MSVRMSFFGLGASLMCVINARLSLHVTTPFCCIVLTHVVDGVLLESSNDCVKISDNFGRFFCRCCRHNALRRHHGIVAARHVPDARPDCSYERHRSGSSSARSAG